MVKNQSHTLAYSLIGLQELNLAYQFPTLYWDTACLIADAGGAESKEDDDDYDELFEEPNEKVTETYYNEMEEFTDEDEVDGEGYEEEDCDGYPVEVVTTKAGKKKKKIKGTNYGKVATAIGKIVAKGIQISPPDINKSTYTFSPDLENNMIRYGLNGIAQVGNDIVKEIMAARPFSSIEDFLNKVHLSKPKMVNLIKSGAFDKFGESREDVMRQYITIASGPKQRVTLQNMRMLIEFGLLPSELEFECKVYNFTNYLRKNKQGDYYYLDEIAMRFYESNFDMDVLTFDGTSFLINQGIWDKKYTKLMDPVRNYIKAHKEELLKGINDRLASDLWQKYCKGSISKWEMDSVSYYSHEHELANVNLSIYGCIDFNSLPEEPVVDKKWWKDGNEITMYKIFRIAGTVLDKNKNKGIITLLTTTGVVTVKIFGPVFAQYDKQISIRGEDGKKHVMEKSWLSRGNKIIVTGMRRGDSFIGKKYKSTPYHLVELIDEIIDPYIITKQQRYGEGVEL